MEAEDAGVPSRTEDKRPSLELGQGETSDAVFKDDRPRTTAIRIFPLPIETGLGIPPNSQTMPRNTKKLKPLRKAWNFDENKNVVKEKKPKNFRFLAMDSESGDSEDEAEKLYGKYLEPKPSKWRKSSPFLGYLFFWNRRRLVRFPSEVVEMAESNQQFGETMGKFREVRRSTKHRQRLSTLLTSDDLLPVGEPDFKNYRVLSKDLPYPPDGDSLLLRDNSPKCNYWFCLCGTGKKTKKPGFSPEEEGREPPLAYSDKFKVTEQKFARTLDVIEEFTVGNLKTINYTLGVIGLMPVGPKEDEEEDRGEGMGRFNHIAAGVWFFTFAIEELFHNETDAPTKSEFEELLIEFTNLAVVADHVARRTVIYSQLHSAFGETAMTRLRSATNRLHVYSQIMDEFKIRPPAKLGHALLIQNPQNPSDGHSSSTSTLTLPPTSFKIVTRPWHAVPKSQAQNPWLPFSNQSKSFKLDYLKDFLTKLQLRIVTLNVQMRFLADDIFERNLRSFRGRGPKPQSFLSALYSLNVVMYRFSVFKETTPKYERALMETMEAVAVDTYELLAKGEIIIEAIIEIRDMVELAVSYMVEVYEIDFERLIPNDLELNSKGGACRSCCNKLGRVLSDDLVESSPGFKSSDFFNTIFPLYLQKRAMLHTETGYEFELQPDNQGARKVRRRFAFPPTEPSVQRRNVQSIPNMNLEPPLGSESLWDDLSRVDITTLKDHIIDSTPDLTDVKPSIATEIRRREAFDGEIKKH